VEPPYFATWCVVVKLNERMQVDFPLFKEQGPDLIPVIFHTSEVWDLGHILKYWPATHHDIVVNRVPNGNLLHPCEQSVLNALRTKVESEKAPWLKGFLEDLPGAQGQPLSEVLAFLETKREERKLAEKQFLHVWAAVGWAPFHHAYRFIRDFPETGIAMPPQVAAYQDLCLIFDPHLKVTQFRGDWFLHLEDDLFTTASLETLKALAQEFPPPPEPEITETVMMDINAALDELLSETQNKGNTP